MMGLFLEEIKIGKRFELGHYTFTEDNIRSFSARFAPVGFHLDDAEAGRGLFGGRVAAGWQICCGWMVCFVASNTRARARGAAEGKALPEIGPSPGLTDLRWPAPVHAGDAIHYGIAIVGQRVLNSRRRWGMVSMDAEGRKLDGTIVMTFSGNVMVARKG